MKLKGIISEIEFKSQSAFDAYKEKHKMRDTTKVKVAGKETTAGEASKKSDSVSKSKGGASAGAKKVEPKKIEPVKDEPKSEPKKLRQGNPTVNKATKAKAEKLGITPEKLGRKEYELKMAQAAYEALTDSNYHTEARELVAKLEGKPEMAERPEYPSMKDPKFKEKMAAISKKYASKYSDNTDDDARELGIAASQEAGWGGIEAADSIAFTLRMNGFHKLADTIQSVFEGKPYMKNESLFLKKIIKK